MFAHLYKCQESVGDGPPPSGLVTHVHRSHWCMRSAQFHPEIAKKLIRQSYLVHEMFVREEHVNILVFVRLIHQ